jgi:alanine racemase
MQSQCWKRVTLPGCAVNSWIEVSDERLAANYRALTRASGKDTAVLAVVKANAYGHGTEVCAVELAMAGARWFGVANVDEGTRVRTSLDAAGFGGTEILVMCGILPEDVTLLTQHRLTPVVWTAEQLGWLKGSGIRPHIEVETGMGRQGVRPDSELDLLLDALAEAGLQLDGMMTHFCAAEAADGVLTLSQEKKFAEAVEQVRARGLKLRWLHAGSSSSLDNPAGGDWLTGLAKTIGAQAMVRCGIALYGYCLPIAGTVEAKVRPALKPVMTWKTRVIDVRDVKAGEAVGYNAMYTAQAAMRVALLPVGYADGLRRELSSTNERAGGWVKVRGQRANILGRISMNLTVVDVTEIEGVRVGDEVVLLGDGVTADDHARLAATISYEILCGVRATPGSS